MVRALGIWMVGMLADRIGLQGAFLWSGVSALFSVPALFLLPSSTSYTCLTLLPIPFILAFVNLIDRSTISSEYPRRCTSPTLL